LRDAFPQLQPHLLNKRALISLSRAIEDEAVIRAERPLLFGCFQQERHFRAVESRWRELSRTAERAIVLADFRRKRRSARGPAEIPIRNPDPLMREWVVVCESPRFAACLVGIELPTDEPGGRKFETIWSVESGAVREAARICVELTARTAPELVEDLPQRLSDPVPPARDELRTAIDLTTRMVRYAVNGASAG
jgi:DICT domain-containing protein